MLTMDAPPPPLPGGFQRPARGSRRERPALLLAADPAPASQPPSLAQVPDLEAADPPAPPVAPIGFARPARQGGEQRRLFSYTVEHDVEAAEPPAPPVAASGFARPARQGRGLGLASFQGVPEPEPNVEAPAPPVALPVAPSRAAEDTDDIEVPDTPGASASVVPSRAEPPQGRSVLPAGTVPATTGDVEAPSEIQGGTAYASAPSPPPSLEASPPTGTAMSRRALLRPREKVRFFAKSGCGDPLCADDLCRDGPGDADADESTDIVCGDCSDENCDGGCGDTCPDLCNNDSCSSEGEIDVLDSWDEGGFAVEHQCEGKTCLAFVQEAYGWVGSYRTADGNRLDGWLSGKVCFAEHGGKDSFGGCSVKGCAEEEQHFHVHDHCKGCSSGLAPEGPLTTLVLAPECLEPPTEAIRAAQDEMQPGGIQNLLPARLGKKQAASWGHLSKVGQSRVICELQAPSTARKLLDGVMSMRPTPDFAGLADSGPSKKRNFKRLPDDTPGTTTNQSPVASATPMTKRKGKLSKSKSTVMDVEGICCPSEVPIIETILTKLPGIEKVSTNVTARTTTVVHDETQTSQAELVEALNAASLGASLRRGAKSTRPLKMPSLQLQLCGILWLASLLSLIIEGSEDLAHVHGYAALAAAAIGLPRIGKKALGAIRHGILDINCLMVIASVGAFALGDYVEGAAVVFWFGLSEWLEEIATSGARSALADVLALRPEEAVLERTGEKVSVDEVEVGDRLVVRSGEKVPVDGLVVQGATSLDESALTGESVPVKKRPGSHVAGGAVNVGGGYLVVEAMVEAKDSSVARMVKLIEDSNSMRSRTEVLTERFAKVYTPTLIISAFLCGSLSWLLLEKHAALGWLRMALVLLVMACPCALIISTPVAYVSALSCAASHNVVIRGGEFVEALARLRTICFDKTGTLTEGRFMVRQVLAFHGADASPEEMRRLLGLVVAVEQNSTHPLARALVAHGKAEGAEAAGAVEDFLERPGEGVEAKVDGQMVQVGSYGLATKMGWLEGGTAHEVAALEAAGQTVCLVGVDGRLAAAFGVSDAPRKEAAEGVAEIKKLGVQAVMLTGDRQAPAEIVAAKLGLDGVRAELLPADKADAVQQLKAPQQHRRCRPARGSVVAMLGDGINDAAALGIADVGIAMGAAGTQVAVESAHMVLMDSDLRKLATSVQISRFTVQKIKQNISFALFSKVFMVALAMCGYGSMWGAIILDLGAMLVVTVNASRVLGLSKKKSRKWLPRLRNRRRRGGKAAACTKPCCADRAKAAAEEEHPVGCQDACCAGKRRPGRSHRHRLCRHGRCKGISTRGKRYRHQRIQMDDEAPDLEDGQRGCPVGCSLPCCQARPAPFED